MNIVGHDALDTVSDSNFSTVIDNKSALNRIESRAHGSDRKRRKWLIKKPLAGGWRQVRLLERI